MSAPLAEDRGAGFTGLLVAAALLLLILGGIVKLTNKSYERQERAPSAQHR